MNDNYSFLYFHRSNPALFVWKGLIESKRKTNSIHQTFFLHSEFSFFCPQSLEEMKWSRKKKYIEAKRVDFSSNGSSWFVRTLKICHVRFDMHTSFTSCVIQDDGTQKQTEETWNTQLKIRNTRVNEQRRLLGTSLVNERVYVEE